MCIDLRQTGSVGEGSDHLQLIKFWPSCAPRKGVCGGVKIFGSALLQPTQCLRLSERYFYKLHQSCMSVIFVTLEDSGQSAGCRFWRVGGLDL